MLRMTHVTLVDMFQGHLRHQWNIGHYDPHKQQFKYNEPYLLKFMAKSLLLLLFNPEIITLLLVCVSLSH